MISIQDMLLADVGFSSEDPEPPSHVSAMACRPIGNGVGETPSQIAEKAVQAKSDSSESEISNQSTIHSFDTLPGFLKSFRWLNKESSLSS